MMIEMNSEKLLTNKVKDTKDDLRKMIFYEVAGVTLATASHEIYPIFC